MSDLFYHLGTCPFCDQGLLGVRTCGNCLASFVICDECEAVWETPDTSEPASLLELPDIPCPHCESSLVADPSRWATLDEIEQLDWQDHIQGEYSSLESDAADEAPLQFDDLADDGRDS